LGGVADAVQGHLEVDSQSMTADFNAIMKEAGWLVFPSPAVQKSEFQSGG
jgi:hypothetical protein